jgi:hypothetical protein
VELRLVLLLLIHHSVEVSGRDTPDDGLVELVLNVLLDIALLYMRDLLIG